MAMNYISSDDELPDLDVLLERLQQRTRTQPSKPAAAVTNKTFAHEAVDARPALAKRPQGKDNLLRRPLGRGKQSQTQKNLAGERHPAASEAPKSPQLRHLRSKRSRAPTGAAPSSRNDREGVSPTVVISSDSASDFGSDAERENNGDDDDDDTFYSTFSSVSPRQDSIPPLRSRQLTMPRENPHNRNGLKGSAKLKVKATAVQAADGVSKSRVPSSGNLPGRPQAFAGDDDVAESLARLNLTSSSPSDSPRIPASPEAEAAPLTPPRKGKQTLISPRKQPALPKTPHRPSMDLFWDQEFVNEWNEEFSPKKLVLPPVTKSPIKEVKMNKTKPVTGKITKKAFEQSRHQLAETFLAELDDTILHGQLKELANPTGGVKIEWSKKLNTTAGRANWRKETVRSRPAGSTESVTTYRHHATIELAEKVIDDEHRLLNVIAHEFCHLANFMVSGITGNPHGKEFKAWAAKVSRAFESRGIEVTTKHSYDIDFKYVWTCTECATDFKRHSRSINTERHRCGACKGLLQQTKPVPRNTNGKKSEYQQFVQEQMPIVKRENPGSPQKGMMRLVAQKWAHRTAAKADSDSQEPLRDLGAGEAAGRLGDLVQ